MIELEIRGFESKVHPTSGSNDINGMSHVSGGNFEYFIGLEDFVFMG